VTFTIRARLTLLYFLVLAASFLAFFWICDFGFRRSIETTVNESSRGNLESIHRAIAASQSFDPQKMETRLAELADLWANGAIFEVQGPTGAWIYRSPLFLQAQPPVPPPPGQGIIFFTTNLNLSEYRIATERLSINGRNFQITAAVPTEPFDQALDNFRNIEKEFLPLLVVLASLLGYWLSGRALAPVNRIIRSAELVGVRELSQRLEVPRAKDELRDLTETLNAMLGRIEYSVRRMTKFTADASHDLRTPITLIRTNAELALRRPRSESEYRETLSRILATSEETTRLIEHLLTLARADAGAAQLRFEKVDLIETLRSISRQLKVLAIAKGVFLSEALHSGQAYVLADPAALERLFMAILDNAVRYTPAGGQIFLRLRIENESAFAEIEDTGIGISETDLPHIFDRFFRADQARSGEVRGSGLGLAIAKWIADTHKTSIEVTSNLGRGTRFQVTIPLVPPFAAEITRREEAIQAVLPVSLVADQSVPNPSRGPEN
jgi:two-component system heavy metal sensor histidine kinase CusS